ncbi:hypothetical protein AZH46_04090 [Corynebacterium striatum]|uniref:hypothetical protein n=1 Tax=Corynebacterium striatum TaxID=43770 RepID=UPI000C3BCA60|nr:hypothetical protein [Corynebacterium striatum]PIS66275.1 hypothetical protein AZH46_04090 [Corynebacterium striatum]PXY12764.1 hypothetical protein CKF74_07175 [Corynebacterium striatum]
MALTVSTTFEDIAVIIPAATGDKPVTLTLPPLDCFRPQQVDAINKLLEEHPTARTNGADAMRVMLDYFATTKGQKAAVAQLIARQIEEIDTYWQEESGMKVGES